MELLEIHQIDDEVYAAFERLTPQLSPGSPVPARPFLQAMLAQPNCSLLMARVDGCLCGMLTLVTFSSPMGTHAWIEDVVVDENMRGRGIGEALTRLALQRARQQGAKNVNLTSRPARAAANRLYQRLGFQQWQTNLYRYVLDEPE